MENCSNKEIARIFVEEIWSEGDEAVIESYMHKEIEFHDPMIDGIESREDFQVVLSELHDGFPDFSFEPDRYICDTDTVSIIGDVSGTHGGEFFGITSSGRDLSLNAMKTIRVENGRIVERWSSFDTAVILLELGFSPLAWPNWG